MCARVVAIGNVWTEGDGAVGVCVERWDVVSRCVYEVVRDLS